MRERTVNFTVAENEEAMQVASALLDTPPENIQLAPLSSGDFRAQTINADAELEIGISPDKLEARVLAYAAPTGDGKQLDLQGIHEQLTAAGVVFGIDEQEIARLMDRVTAGDDVHGRVLARGRQPQPPQKARIEPVGDLTRPVLPGMKICRKVPFGEGQNGQVVSGEEIPSEATVEAKDITLSAHSGTELAEEGMAVVATTYGLATIKDGKVEVEPLYAVSPDDLTVSAALCARDSHDEAITVARLQEMLTSSGLVYGFDEKAITKALAIAQEKITDEKTDFVTDVVIMKGVPPEDGEDGKFELFFAQDRQPGEVEEEGEIDLKERSAFLSVTAGQKLGAIAPAKPGRPGTSVRGEPVPAQDGEDVHIQAGEHVEISQDGCTITATINGVIVYARDTLSVTDVLEIPSDVDNETGNIRIDKGSVAIKGTIRTGFTVDVVGNVFVAESIEGATVNAGGDIGVARGLLMHEEGKLMASGSVRANFAENAIIEADSDVVVANNISNCDIRARGKVMAVAEKGKIIGGTIRAAHGVEANEIGSELGVPTNIIVGLEYAEQHDLLDEKAGLTENMRKLRGAVGQGDPKAILEATPKEKRPAMAKVLDVLMSTGKRLAEIDTLLGEITKKQRQEAKGTVRVLRTLHPGATITIAGHHFEPDRPLEGCCLYYDPVADKINMRSS